MSSFREGALKNLQEVTARDSTFLMKKPTRALQWLHRRRSERNSPTRATPILTRRDLGSLPDHFTQVSSPVQIFTIPLPLQRVTPLLPLYKDPYPISSNRVEGQSTEPHYRIQE